MRLRLRPLLAALALLAVARPAEAPAFTREAHAAAVARASLTAADAWVAKYEGDKNGANLVRRLDAERAAFLKDGLLEVAK